MLPKMRQPPIVDIPFLHTLKRKRADSQSFDPFPGPEDTKRRKLSDAQYQAAFLPGRRQSDAPISGGIQDSRTCDVVSHAPSQYPQVDVQTYTPGNPPSLNDNGVAKPSPLTRPNIKPRSSSGPDNRPELSDEAKHSQLQQVIEHQFNIEILVKHRELRLIEQELAKCQTSLEQLRRCEIIPYPGANGLSESPSSARTYTLRPSTEGASRPQRHLPIWLPRSRCRPSTRPLADFLLRPPHAKSSMGR